jgi:hypothetical protein
MKVTATVFYDKRWTVDVQVDENCWNRAAKAAVQQLKDRGATEAKVLAMKLSKKQS